MYVRIIYY